jgi:hypothetical protein
MEDCARRQPVDGDVGGFLRRTELGTFADQHASCDEMGGRETVGWDVIGRASRNTSARSAQHRIHRRMITDFDLPELFETKSLIEWDIRQFGRTLE